MKIAVIIAAHKAEKFIVDCVESVKNQILYKGCEIEIRIGVDGCPGTSEILKKHKIKHYMSNQNYGAYIIRNSLMLLSDADIYCYFDADDKMFENHIAENLRHLTENNIVLTAKKQCNKKLLQMAKPAEVQHGGAMMFADTVLKKLGGYYEYRCACDSDFLDRAVMAGIEIKKIKTPTYLRRVHKASLTKSKKTGYGKQYRKNIWDKLTENRKNGIIKIEPVTVGMRYVV